MTHIPPVPEGNQSPYPIAEPPHMARSPTAVESVRRTDPRPDVPLIAGLAVGVVAVLGVVGLARYLFSKRPARTAPKAPRLSRGASAGDKPKPARRKTTTGRKPQVQAGRDISAPRTAKAAAKTASRKPAQPAKAKRVRGSDDTTIRGPRDAALIAMGEDYEVAYWIKRFGVDREALQAAVDAVGHGSRAVADHLGKA